ncbi:pentatricopeptide repeat-containing protein At1g77360, mitochondrial-like [Nymphaea colorata]|nr:pentatricopeptide repeat-containing protein At1g77360, mitochondrial-like [Nymphaea colorata]XP_049932445.1 pentatricopeptide repeat-containing protein At1g77360, mitochondrial-like [Nymphaea colorata]XP_049932446.1 pentatricopeptide repeat-containing protein At1g77360, mitochondrial-like [Nymphaea colorata]XP_049932447.1 pentatricopeptide repeat-containing protein At1g77360, mitochondrial-like [Nymphaea colorata]
MIRRNLAHAILFSLSQNNITTITFPSSPFSSFCHQHFPHLPPPSRQSRKKLPPATDGIYRTNPLVHRSLPERSRTSLPKPLPDCASRRDVQRVCSLLCLYRDPDFDHLFDGSISEFDSEMILGVLMNYRRLGRKTTLAFFSWVGFRLGFRFDDRVIEFMADFLGRRKLFDDLKCLLKSVSSHGGSVSPRTVAISIRFLGRQGRIGEALSLFEEMEAQFGFVPDNVVFNNVLYVLCKKTPLDESSINSMAVIDTALSMFRRIECPDKYSYSNIIVGLCKFGRWETAQKIFHEMRDAGMMPTRSAVNMFIGELCASKVGNGRTGKIRISDQYRSISILVPAFRNSSDCLEPAVDIFWWFWDMGVLPSTFVLTRFIQGLCSLRKMDEVLKILKVVEEKGLEFVNEWYPIVIRGLCDVGSLDEACEMFWKMLSHGLNPKLKTYNALISALCEAGDLKEAENVFSVMNKKRCAPDGATCTSLLHGWCRCDNWEAAHELMNQMLDVYLCPDAKTSDSVGKLIRKHGHVDLSLKLQAKMEAVILRNHCKAGRLGPAYEKLSSMLARGIYPPLYVKELFEDTFWDAGKWEEARDLLKQMS